jgi:hypothetical protein
MSLLRRPNGDEIAEQYGDYFDIKRIELIKCGERYEGLCRDGLNYIVEVKEFNPKTYQGHLHFPQWKTRFDFKGSLKDVYITDEGTYSKDAGITSLNTYDFDVSANAKRSSQPKKSIIPSGAKSTYAANTKYDEDFFSKPRPPWAKKRRSSSDFSRQEDDAQSAHNSSDDSSSADEQGTGRTEFSQTLKRQRLSEQLQSDIDNTHAGTVVLADKVPQHALLQNFINTVSPRSGEMKSVEGQRQSDDTMKMISNTFPIQPILKLASVDTKKLESDPIRVNNSLNGPTHSSANRNGSDSTAHLLNDGPSRCLASTYNAAPIVSSSLKLSTNERPQPYTQENNGSAAIIPDDIKTLVDTLELSYTVDETQKVIDVIRAKSANLPCKGHVTLLLQLLQVRRNIDQSILEFTNHY